MSKKAIKFPFDLPDALEYFFVEVPPKIAQVMANGEAEEQNAIALIAPKLIQNDDQLWGFDIVRRYGLTFKERVKLEKLMAIDREAMGEAIRLFQRIAEETGKTLEEIQEAARSGDLATDMETYGDYIEDFVDIEARTTQTDVYLAEATTLMQRAFSNWTLEHTQALHPRILEQVTACMDAENYGEDEETDEGEA